MLLPSLILFVPNPEPGLIVFLMLVSCDGVGNTEYRVRLVRERKIAGLRCLSGCSFKSSASLIWTIIAGSILQDFLFMFLLFFKLSSGLGAAKI